MTARTPTHPCPACGSLDVRGSGKFRTKARGTRRRWRCHACGGGFSTATSDPFRGLRLSEATMASLRQALDEKAGLVTTARRLRVTRKTVRRAWLRWGWVPSKAPPPAPIEELRVAWRSDLGPYRAARACGVTPETARRWFAWFAAEAAHVSREEWEAARRRTRRARCFEADLALLDDAGRRFVEAAREAAREVSADWQAERAALGRTG